MSPLKDLRIKYGKTTSRQAINAAIRAELPGGPGVLDLMELTHHAAERLGWEDPDGKPSLLRVIHEQLCAAANAMEAEIRRRYGMPPM